MAEITTGYEEVTPSLIENTTMRKFLINGVARTYNITPNEGYVLHDNTADYDDENGNITLRYSRGGCSCGITYDFSTTQVTAVNGQTVTAYGSREFYAIPESEVPADQIYGGDNNHEVMSETEETETE